MHSVIVGGLMMVLLSHAGGSAVADDPARTNLWLEAAAVLDTGRNAEAIDLLQPLLVQFPGRLELAELYFQARVRSCDLEAAVHRAEEPLRTFRAAYLLRLDARFDEAGDTFLASARLAVETGDTLSYTVATQEAAECLASASKLDTARTLLADLDGPLARQPTWGRLTARSLQLLGLIASLETDHDAAAPLLRQAIEMVGPEGNPTVLFDSWNALGTFRDKECYRHALDAAERANDPYRIVRALVNLTFVSSDKNLGGEASKFIDRAESILADCDQPYLAGYVPAMRGIIMGHLGRRPEAIALLQKAHQLHVAGRNPRGQVTSQQWLAFHLQTSGRYLEARAHLEDCLRILQERDSLFIMNWILFGLANINRVLGHADEAIALYGQAADHYERVHGRGRGVALCLNEAGMCHTLKGEYREALACFGEAASIQRTLGEGHVSDYVLTNMADAYFHLGNYNEALDHYQRALDRLGVSADEEEPSRGSFPLSRIAALYGITGHPDRATGTYRRALKLARKAHVRETELHCLVGLATQELVEGRLGASGEYLEEAENLLTDEGQFALRSRVKLLQARSAKDPATALGLAGQALAAAVAGGLPDQEWNCLTEIGEFHLAVGDTAAAVEAQERAIDVIESLRRRVGADELGRHMLTPAIIPYERLLAILLTDHDDGPHPAHALALAERSRTRILAERLERNLTRTHDPAFPGATEVQRELRADMTRVLDQLQEADLSPAERKKMRGKIAEIERQFTLLQAGDAVGLPWSSLQENPREMLATLRPDECMISYFLGTRQSVVFSISNEGIDAHQLPPRAFIEKRVRLFLGFRQNGGNPGTDLPDSVFQIPRRELYDMLLRPVTEDLEFKERVIIVPDGVLHRLPFAILEDGNGGLITDHELVLAPSLLTLAKIRDRSRRRAGGDENERHLLAIGCSCDPCPGRATRIHPFTDEAIPPLPHADREASTVANLFPTSQLLNGSASGESAVKAALMAKPDLVHIAAHGYADPRHSERSFIVLSLPCDADAAAEEDGLLQWHEIVSLNLESSLVVLSACHTAGGPLAVGEGVTGLSQAFLEAGGTCVLASLDGVPDRYASRFMGDVHRRLADGDTPATALRGAQLTARKRDSGGPDAGRWAGFVLIGDGTVSTGVDDSSTLFFTIIPYGLVIGALMMAIAAALLLRRRFSVSPRPRRRSNP